jgi:hypothetical protein
MIVVRVELHSANGKPVLELARMELANRDNLVTPRRNYVVRTFRGRSREALNRRNVYREGHIEQWPAERMHVWNLIFTALERLGYSARR